MVTIKEKILEAKKIEDFCNSLRDKMSQLQYQKRMLEREKKDVIVICDQINSIKEILIPNWEKFEVLLKEIGSDNYYNYLKKLDVKEMNKND